MKKFLYSFFSMGTTLVLFLIFAVASGAATVIESMYGTDAAWAYIYKTNWFGAIQILLGISLFVNIFKYKLYKKGKLPSFIFHLSFLFILIGSIITRYFGFEGSLHIRQDHQNNIVSSSVIYIQLMSKEDDNKTVRNDLTSYISTNPEKNSFDLDLEVDGKTANLEYKNFILNSAIRWVEGVGGEPILELLFSNQQHKKNITFIGEDSQEIGDLSLAFNEEPKQSKYIKIFLKDDKFYINTNEHIEYTDMKTMQKGVLELNKDEPFEQFKIYNIDGINFSAKTLLKSGVQGVVSLPEKSMGNNALVANLNYNGESKDVFMLFGDYPRSFTVGGKEFKLAWSPKDFVLPFSLYLKEFKMDRYPGSNSPSGYSSDVIVKDGENELEYKIYMNHVLDYAGYRFFQSSYDRDEKGTILTVNRDPGKFPTYIGYFLLFVGMFFNFFNSNSRFSKLSKLIDESSNRQGLNDMKKKKRGKKVKGLALILMAFLSISTTTNLKADTPPPTISKEHASKLAGLTVQGFDGRMAPFDTVSRDLMHKIYRGENYKGLNSNQVMLSIMVNPEFWRNEAFIKIGNSDELKKILGLPKSAKRAKFGDFFGRDENGKSFYKLGKLSEEVNRKPIGNRNTFDKELLKADERLNIFYALFLNEMFRIIPKENDENHAWFSTTRAMMSFPSDEAQRVSDLLKGYFPNVLAAQKNGDWSKADRGLEALKEYQKKIGANVVPSDNKIKFEILFNKINIFENLMPVYLIAGFLLLIFVFVRMLKPKVNINFAFNTIYAVNILAFSLHTIGLLLRWYIAEHAPWSNAYESLVYIAWALSLSGIIFSKKSPISLSLTSILAGITLFVAHLSGMDPQITNIQPVLNSYWLTIHVSVITASYGFLGLSALLGLFTLVLFILRNRKNEVEITKNILEATRINEMSMILGLCLLTCGNFLGGIWANESWGRYWGWDSKETWSLVTILVYAAIVHFRFVPKLNNQYWFGVASMFAYASVIMTYFGVNFYLTGKHSYAAGESVPIPPVVWVSALILCLVAFFSFFKREYAKKL